MSLAIGLNLLPVFLATLSTTCVGAAVAVLAGSLALAVLGNADGIFVPWLVGFIADHRNLHRGLASSALAPFATLRLVLRLRR